MPLEETIYSTSQISIPAELPDLLKQYTKAAIRTQPPDILQWWALIKYYDKEYISAESHSI